MSVKSINLLKIEVEVRANAKNYLNEDDTPKDISPINDIRNIFGKRII